MVDIPVNLTCWYLNSRRVMELVGIDAVTARLRPVNRLDEHLRQIAQLVAQNDALIDWLNRAKPPTLGQLLAKNELAPGKIFTHYSNFFFKGLSAVGAALRKGKSAPMAKGYSKLDAWAEGSRLCFDFHHEHLTSNSSWAELRGQKRMFLLALITDIDDGIITAIPYVIANPAPDLMDRSFGRWGSYWWNSLEVHVDGIDSFSRVGESSWRPKRSDLTTLRDIPEIDIKRAFASIIFEETIPNDWGGERSDLLTSRSKGKGYPQHSCLKVPHNFDQ